MIMLHFIFPNVGYVNFLFLTSSVYWNTKNYELNAESPWQPQKHCSKKAIGATLHKKRKKSLMGNFIFCAVKLVFIFMIKHFL